MSLGEYCRIGPAAPEWEEAKVESARVVLFALAREYAAAGKSGRELSQVMSQELEGAQNSLELSILQREVLSLEIAAYKPASSDKPQTTEVPNASGRPGDPSRLAAYPPQGVAEEAMADLPKLPPDAWARIELVKLDAAERLRKEVSSLRSTFVPDQDEGLYFQGPLCFSYADYIAEVFFANVDEYIKSFGLHRTIEELNPISWRIVLSTHALWVDSGGQPEYRDSFVETAYKVIQKDKRYKEFLGKVASAGLDASELHPVGLESSKKGNTDESQVSTGQDEVAARIQWLVVWRQQQQDIAVQGALERLGRKSGWAQAQLQLIQADEDRARSIASGSADPWQVGVRYYTAVAEAWLGLVADSQSAQDFYTILPVIVGSVYDRCFQGATPETFRPASADSHQFQKDLAMLDRDFRKRAAERALRQAGFVVTGSPAEARGEDRARLAAISVQGIAKGAMLTDPAFWRDLEAQFRALPDPTGRLTAMLSDGHWGICGGPSDKRKKERLQAMFRSLATRAAIATGVPNRANALDVWLNLLREESPHFHPLHGTSYPNGVETHDEGGSIQNLALASAEYCIERATRAFELETAAEDPGSLGLGDADPLAGWVPAHRADWREDAAFARECPPFLRPVEAARLDAIAKLRKDAAEVVQHTKPQTRQELEQSLWPVFSEYARDVFDKMAEAELGASGRHRRTRDYRTWLKSECVPAVVVDVCLPVFGQFPITVRYVAEIVGEVSRPQQLVIMRQVLWVAIAEEVVPGPDSSTKRLENRLMNTLLEERIPHWEAKAAQRRPATASEVSTQPQPAPGSRDLDAAPDEATSGRATPEPEQPSSPRTPRRVPNLDVSRQRLRLLDALATELATLKQDLKGYCTGESLKTRHPEFILWTVLKDYELKELVDGEHFTPKAYAETLTIRKFGITSRETLKKDRQKLRKAQRNQPGPPSS